jgi:hypothetical protein
MQDRIKAFFEGVGSGITEYLGPGADILINAGNASYTLRLTKDRAVEVEKGAKGSSDIEIITQEDVLSNLLSSPSLKDYRGKMAAYVLDDRRPQVKILMDRSDKNAARFVRLYVYFLRRMYLLN